VFNISCKTNISSLTVCAAFKFKKKKLNPKRKRKINAVTKAASLFCQSLILAVEATVLLYSHKKTQP